MKKITLSIFFLLLLAKGFSQNLCLEKLPPADSMDLQLCSRYNSLLGPPADFNNDGHPDLVYCTEYVSVISMQTYYYLGIISGDGTGIYTVDTIWQAAPGPKTFVTGDFNEDGHTDFVSASPAGPIQLHTGNGNMGFAVSSVQGNGTFWTSIVSADFNSDGHLDLLLAGSQMGGIVSFIPGNGNGTFGAPVVIASIFNTPLEKGDFNNDGLTDVALSNGILFNYGSNNFVTIPMTMPQGLLNAADVNQDGNTDLIGADTIYLGTGAGTFPVHVAIGLPAGASLFTPVPDMNGDGSPDLLARKTGSQSRDTLLIFTGNGNATFTQTAVNLPLDSLYGLGTVGDIDSNGMTDLVMVRSYIDFETPMTSLYTVLNHTAHITASSPALCQGDSLLLYGNAGGLNYNWSNGDTTASISVNTAGTYSLTVTAPGGCLSTSVYTVNAVTATTFAPITTSGHFCYYSSPFTLTTGAPAGGSYSGPGITNGVFDPEAAGVGTHMLYYTVTGSGNCTGTDSLQVIVDLCMGIASADSKQELQVYPNPATDVVTISWSNPDAAASLMLFDALGNVVLRRDAVNGTETRISTSELAAGIYSLCFISGAKREFRKLVVVR